MHAAKVSNMCEVRRTKRAWLLSIVGPAFQLSADQLQLATALARNGCIVLRPADKIGHHRRHRRIGNIFGHVITGLRKIERDMIAHSLQLGTSDARIVWFHSMLLHEDSKKPVAVVIV